jgi:acetyl-CoA carboxylase carboxyltransferase component
VKEDTARGEVEDRRTQAKLDELRQRRDEGLHPGDERAVENRSSRRKLLAREPIKKLLDPGSLTPWAGHPH